MRGESVYCGPCRDYREVDIAAPQFTARCGQCGFGGRQWGANRQGAIDSALKHVRRRQVHVVSILDGRTVVERVVNGDDMLPLALPPVGPTEDHQRSLRNVTKS